MQFSKATRQLFSNLFLFTALTTSVVSCKKEKDNNDPTPPPASQRIKEFKNGEEFIRFDYNVNGDVNKVTLNSDITDGSTLTYTVNYNAAKKITSLETTDEKITPVYENNILTRADIFMENERVGYTAYQYEGGLIEKATIYFGEGNDYIPALEFIFTYTATGNIEKTETFLATGEPGQMERSGHVSYQYDQKSNPLYAQRELMALFWQAVSKNNIIVENHFDANLQPEDKFTYDYLYNSSGLPKSAVVKQGLPGQPTVTSNLDYIYQ
ncbi:hypothetical protein [Terrimonas alba]|uniref:hypothetical protein n=1 Tax=Terrimonas alba TaxID=3349636 RepID=UPI0035F2E9D9